MAEPLFRPRGDAYLPSEVTRGGWDDASQHGSPPSGLLARAVEEVETPVPMQVARFTVDLFRPVPLLPLTVRTTVRRDGRRIQVVDADLLHDGVEVGRATALRIRLADVDLPDREEEGWVQPPPPAEADLLEVRGVFGGDRDVRRFHTDGVEIRTFDRSFLRFGPGLSWFRLCSQVVEGEAPSPFVTVATLADMSNGNSQALDPREWLYVNPDLTLYLHRAPVGEWIGMRSEAHQHRSGIGLADTRLFDLQGPIGRVAQAQIVAPRRPG